jgi:hypothetical protein
VESVSSILQTIGDFGIVLLPSVIALGSLVRLSGGSAVACAALTESKAGKSKKHYSQKQTSHGVLP